MATRKQSAVPTYPGPTRSEVFALSDVQVLKELERLQEEPRKLPYEDADDDLFVLAYGQKALDDESAYTKAEIKELRRSVLIWHAQCLKAQLFTSYVHEWIASLSESACWKIIEDHEGETVPLSEKRYLSREKLRERTSWSVFACLGTRQETRNYEATSETGAVSEVGTTDSEVVYDRPATTKTHTEGGPNG